MASTQVGAQLTEAHRQRQLGLRARVTRQLLDIYPVLDLDDLDATWRPTLAALTALVRSGRQVSARFAADYYQAFRVAEGIGGQATPVLAADIDPARLRASLGYAGPATAQQLRLVRPGDLRPQVLTKLTGATTRHVVNAGRDTLVASVAADPAARGWARVTAGSPCGFCAMLAGRGPTFKTQQSASFQAHDHCGCTAEPVYRADQPWPGRSREFQELWSETTEGMSGAEARNAFRRAVEAR